MAFESWSRGVAKTEPTVRVVRGSRSFAGRFPVHMRILEVIPYFHPKYGGPVEMVSLLSRKLIERGHRVTIYTTEAFPGSPDSIAADRILPADGVNVHYFKDLTRVIARNQNLFFSPGIVPVAKKQIKDFDIIHLHDYRAFQSIIVHHYALKYGVPYVLQTHGSIPRMVAKRNLKRLFDILWGNTLLKDASKTIAITQLEATQLQDVGVSSDKIEIVPNGIDLTEIGESPQKGKFRRKYGLRDDQKIVLYLGRIHKIKGLDVLVKAFVGLTKKLSDVMLVIVGPDDGFLTGLLKLRGALGIGDRMLLVGPLYGQEKLAAYADADVYVLPSIHEVFGMTVLEACACGIPVVLTENCGLANWVVESRAGYAVPSGDEAKLQEACLRILTDESLRKSMGERGKQMVKDHFSLDRVVQRVEEIYSSCMKNE